MNRLAEASSEYLKQHAQNPVHWWPWCDEAFAVAKQNNKPVLLSVGFSSCHWCHVMAHECFEDAYIAELMNRHFVCVKVDREERPDVDQIYMEAVQMLGQRGGWPLNVFCFPDGRPFFGGTYFPPEDRGHGIIPWPQLLMRIAKSFEDNPEELSENADNIVKNLNYSNVPLGADGNMPKVEDLVQAISMILESHDDEWGGFGDAPKFPSPMTLSFLLEFRSSSFCDNKERIGEVVIKTLKAMAHGGIYDQFGGGFSRYSVDKYWLVPHFEKMLSDNAQLISIYAKAYAQYKIPLFKSVVEETIDWLITLRSNDALVYASVDADSEGKEGKYYVWTPEEIIKVLGPDDGQKICDAYNITKEGSFEEGTSVPAWVYDDAQEREALKALREQLDEHRYKTRAAPNTDKKLLLSSNALFAKALVDAGFWLNNKYWVSYGQEICDFIWINMQDAQGRFVATYNEEGDSEAACLDDYAYLAQAMITLATRVDWINGSSRTYLRRAREITDFVIDHFMDKNEVGFFFTANYHEKLICRKKQWLDNTLPSGNSIMLSVFRQLYELTYGYEGFSGGTYFNECLNLSKAYGGLTRRAPNAIAAALENVVLHSSPIPGANGGLFDGSWEILTVKDHKAYEKAAQWIQSKPKYRKVAIMLSDDPKSMKEDYQLCRDLMCDEPTSNLADLDLS